MQIALVAVALLALQDEKPAKQEKPEIKTHEVAKGNLVPVIKVDGTFEPAASQEVKIRFEVFTGKLEVLEVAPLGAEVAKGDVILKIDPEPIQKRIDAAENDLRVARAELRKTEADYEADVQADALALRQAEDVVAYAEKALQLFDDVTGKQMLKMNKMSVQFREDSVRDTEEELKQLLEMYKSEELTNATAEIVVKRTKRSLERSKVYLEMAREDAEIVREVNFPRIRKNYVYSLEEARHALEALKRAQTLAAVKRDAGRVKARVAFDDEEKKLADLKKDLEGFTVRASMDGRVYYGAFQRGAWPNAEQMKKMLKPGEKIMPGQPLMTVCGVAGGLFANVPEAKYFDVRAGQAAVVKPGALPGKELKGRVTRRDILSLPGGSGAAFQVRLVLDAPPATLLPGMKAKVEISGDELKDVLLVPSKAVSVEEGVKGEVTVLDAKGEKEKREVTVGATDGERTEIREGLKPGEKVVLPE